MSQIAEIDLIAYEGTTFRKTFIRKSGDPSKPINMEGYTGECHIRDKITDKMPVFILKNDEGVIIKDQSKKPGYYELYINHTETKDKCINHKERKMVYDLRLVSPKGIVEVQQKGIFTLKPVVTRPWQKEKKNS